MANSMMIIKIYKHCGTGAFTDKSKELAHEPFVCGIPEIIDLFISNHGDKTRETHKITFSDQNFPGAQGMLTKTHSEHSGTWYSYGKKEGWLSPTVFKYFPKHPSEIYVAMD